MPIDLDYAPGSEFDTGRFVARYLQVLAWLSIASMIAGTIFFHSFYLDLSFVFLFWAASALRRRSPTARVWVLVIAILMLLLCAAFLALAVARGPASMRLWIGGKQVGSPTLWQVLLVLIPAIAVVAAPVAVLMSPSARRQFARGHRSERLSRVRALDDYPRQDSNL